MRLIDANSIKFRPYYDEYVDYDGYINDLKTWQLDDILSDRVDNTPTVKAIPIEWINSYTTGLIFSDDYEDNADSIDYYISCIKEMVRDWEKENE